MIGALAFLVFALLCLYAGGSQLTKMGDERLAQLSRGALSPWDWDRVIGAWLLVGCGIGFAVAALITLGWWPGG